MSVSGDCAPAQGIFRHVLVVARQLSEPSHDSVATDAAVTTATATAIHDSWAAMSATANRAQPSLSLKPDSLRSIRAGAYPDVPRSRAAPSSFCRRAWYSLMGRFMPPSSFHRANPPPAALASV